MKNLKKQCAWISWGILICLGVSVILTLFYSSFRRNAQNQEEHPIEEIGNLGWLYRSAYLLYHDLYNVQNGTRIDYVQLFLKPEPGYELLLDRERLEQFLTEEEAGETHEGVENTEEPEESPDGIPQSAELLREILSDREQTDVVMNQLLQLEAYFIELKQDFSAINSLFDYCILDNSTGKYVTNMSEAKAKALSAGTYDDYFFLVTFCFDEAGNVSVGDVRSQHEDKVRKNANAVVRNDFLSAILTDKDMLSGFSSIASPENCTVYYGITAKDWETLESNFYVSVTGEPYNTYSIQSYIGDDYSLRSYRNVGVGSALLLCLLGVALLGLLLPLFKETKPWNDLKLLALPVEALVLIGVFAVSVISDPGIYHVAYCASGRAAETIQKSWQIDPGMAALLTVFYNLAILSCLLFPGWYLGVSARALTERGLKRYIRERSLIYRFGPFVKRKVQGAYRELAHLDLTANSHKAIIRVILCNAVILFAISSLWIGGFMVTIIYSLLLYVILRKYISDLQERYGILLRATNEMAKGNLNVTIQEDIGVFEPFKPELAKIQEGFRKAVDEEVKSQRMKSELITNVSHDLKTPLTAIITYVNLLQEDSITEEQRKEYLRILEQKSLRLKVLIEDLFEVSKANSQNITLNLASVDIMNLVKQVAFEMTDKLEEASLDVRMDLTDEKVLVSLDSQKTYRVYENLFGNIAKYAMKGTRVYVSGRRVDDSVVITLKNISAQELPADSENLTERFVRGDVSRNTEGSGLGLAIAKSFTELQGGSFVLEVDGDLFKITTTWKVL